MTRRALVGSAFAITLTACGAPGPGSREPAPREEVTAEQMRDRWKPLAEEELAVVIAVDELALTPPAERSSRLAKARDGAGFIASGLGVFVPPKDLLACRDKALEGATELKVALDGIDALWSGRVTGDRKEAAVKLADDLCKAAAKLSAGRSECGVELTAARAPLACGP